MVVVGTILAGWVLFLSFLVFFVARAFFPLPVVQTLVFVILVFTGQATVYLVRQQGHFWESRPSGWLLASTLFDLLFVGFVALRGILMAPIPPSLFVVLGAGTLLYYVALDCLKVRLLRRFL